MINHVFPKSILFVDDSDCYQLLIQEAFYLLNSPHKLMFISTAEEALNWLNYQAKTPPDLIFLDLHLPKMNGHDLLKKLKQNPKTQSIPVLMLSGSDDPNDILKSYQLQANCHLRKPTNLDSLLLCLQSLLNFWFSVATLPSEILTPATSFPHFSENELQPHRNYRS